MALSLLQRVGAIGAALTSVIAPSPASAEIVYNDAYFNRLAASAISPPSTTAQLRFGQCYKPGELAGLLQRENMGILLKGSSFETVGTRQANGTINYNQGEVFGEPKTIFIASTPDGRGLHLEAKGTVEDQTPVCMVKRAELFNVRVLDQRLRDNGAPQEQVNRDYIRQIVDTGFNPSESERRAAAAACASSAFQSVCNGYGELILNAVGPSRMNILIVGNISVSDYYNSAALKPGGRFYLDQNNNPELLSAFGGMQTGGSINAEGPNGEGFQVDVTSTWASQQPWFNTLAAHQNRGRPSPVQVASNPANDERARPALTLAGN